MQSNTLALQTWTVREPLRLNPERTLCEILELGFHDLELTGNGGRSPGDFSRLCRKYGLQVLGIHQPALTSGDLQELTAETIELCKIYACSFATVSIGPTNRNEYEAYLDYAQLCSKAGAILRDRGITLCYHCYHYDLAPLPAPHASESGLDILLANTAPEELAFELDTHFLYKASVSPHTVLDKCGTRCKLFRLNDIDNGGQQAVLGQGIIPWSDLIDRVKHTCSPSWFILEHSSTEHASWIIQSHSYWREHVAPD